ncbi:MAG: TetR family transcriptional regulator [Rhodobiaceae bacterium]|nr:MAG: TetR family transcriptional regulator [Rhodobiaceae bacterium]
MTQTKRRIRRTKDESQKLILEAAEKLLIEGGASAVQVRAVGNAVGITDAAVNHHFGNRDKLLAELLRHGGRRLKTELKLAVENLGTDDFSVDELINVLCAIYYDQGYADLALGLHLSGWRDKGTGLLNPVVDALHEVRCALYAEAGITAPPIQDIRFVVAMMHQALALGPIFGRAFGRSAGLIQPKDGGLAQQKSWWRSIIQEQLLTVRESDCPV